LALEEVEDIVKKIIKLDLHIVMEEKRDGDPSVLLASNLKI